MIRFLIAAVLVLSACDPADHLEEDLVVRDGLELHATHFPLLATVDDTADPGWLTSTTAWWVGQSRLPVLAEDAEFEDILVSEGYMSNPNALDHTHLEYDSEGGILRCEIVISADIAYDRETSLQVLRHALGHCFGLADDPGPPQTVDLRSIMSSPLDMLGVLTDHDRELLLEMYENAQEP